MLREVNLPEILAHERHRATSVRAAPGLLRRSSHQFLAAVSARSRRPGSLAKTANLSPSLSCSVSTRYEGADS